MTKVSGGAAYQRLSYNNDGLNQSLQFWGQMSARKRDRDEDKQDAENLRKQKKQKEWSEKYGLKPEDFQSKYTGFGSYDDMNRDYSRFNVNKYVELNRQAREALERGDITKKNELEAAMLKRKNNFNLVKQAQEYFAVKYENYKKMVEDGTISGSSKFYEDIVQAIVIDHNVAIREDEYGNPVYTGMTGEGEPFEIAHKDLMDSSMSPNVKQDINGIVESIGDTLGKISKTTEKGLTTIKQQAWSDSIHSPATERAIETLLSDDRVMADILYQVTGGQKIKMSKFTEEDYKEVTEILKQRVKAAHGEKYEEEFNTSRARLGLANRKFKASQDKQKQIIEAEPMTDTSGELLKGYPLLNLEQEAGARFTLNTKNGQPIKGLLSGDKDAEVLSVTKSGGGYYVEVRNQIKDEESPGGVREERKIIKLSDEEINRLARYMQLKDAGELDTYLENRTNSYEQENKQSSGSNDDPLGIL